MTNVLGLPLDMARALLVKEGFAVETVETRSKKGVNGDSIRVVRQLCDSSSGSPVMRLVCCEFKTRVDTDAGANAEDTAIKDEAERD